MILIALARLPLSRLLLALLAWTLSAAALLLPAAALLLSATLAGLLLPLTRTRVLLVGVLLVGIAHAVLPRGVVQPRQIQLRERGGVSKRLGKKVTRHAQIRRNLLRILRRLRAANGTEIEQL